MTRKEQFLQAVQILAPNDALMLQTAQRVKEEAIPVAPGGAALELVVAIQRLRSAANSDGSTPTAPTRAFGSKTAQAQLSLSHALRVKSAEYWLKLGEVDLAFRELETLPSKAWNHPMAVKARVAAVRAMKLNPSQALAE